MQILFKLGVITLIGFSSVCCEIPMSEKSVLGVYVNKNYSINQCCMNSPHKPDTLTLKSGGALLSSFYGAREYKIQYGFSETRISWVYDYKVDSITIDTYFSNQLFENPRIILNYDMNHYYEKIK
jgi:hypothetical protein